MTSGYAKASATAGLLALTASLALSTPSAAQESKAFTLFGQPSVNNDAIWMAVTNDLFEKEGLDITYRLFPSGTTALQTFQTGQGDIALTGDLPSVQYFFRSGKDYRLIAVMERDTEGYVGIANKEITRPEDLIGKKIATRVGSTGSWFISEYLQKNNIDESQVEIINLDTQTMPTALCGRDIAAFFVWQPIGSRTLEICPETAHVLTDATGYMQGYLVAGARPEWLATPEGKEIATAFLRATMAGRDIAEEDFSQVAAYAAENLHLSEEATREQYDTMKRPIAFDQTFYDDFCSLSRWAQASGATSEPLDYSEFLWTEGLESIDPSLVTTPPSPC